MPGRAFRREEGRTVFETLIVAALVSVLIAAAITQYRSSERLLKEAALAIELSNLRSAVTNFAMIEKRLPESLAVLTKTEISIPKKELSGEYRIVIMGKYVDAASVDSEGRPLDPFGARYGYESAAGRVWSTTPGYERW